MAPEDRAAFLAALDRLGEIRRRDGAQSWWRLGEPGAPFRVVEVFLVRDWAEHERMHARSTRADHAAHAAAQAFDRRPGGPRVRHLVGLAPA